MSPGRSGEVGGLDAAEVRRRMAAEVPLLGADADELEALRRWADEREPPASTGELSAFCLFIGYPRSGHSLIGSLLDAHPEMVIAHELDVLRLVDAGFERSGLLAAIAENSRLSAEHGRRWGDYAYEVPGQWQGRWKKLRVVGDKKGGGTSEQLGRDPSLLDRLGDLVDLPCRLIHVIRNPFDMIASKALRDGIPLGRSTRDILTLCEANQAILARVPAEAIFEVRSEAFLGRPRQVLVELCRFLEVLATDEYLEACGALVKTPATRSRHRVEWSATQIREVEYGVAPFDYLAGYGFDEAESTWSRRHPE